MIEGRLKPEGVFQTPLRQAPATLVALSKAQQTGPLVDRSHALKMEGRLKPLPNRKAIEGGALAHAAKPLVYVERVDGFFAHIQGSVAVELPSGKRVFLRYAGKNGHPYTAIGKVLVGRGVFTPDQVSMQSLTTWLRVYPELADEVLQQNASYVFFAEDAARDPALGPKGALGVSLTPRVSIAVDPTWQALGLPVLVRGDNLPFQTGSFSTLAIAQDVGSAIKGAARMDLFLGTGKEAGEAAGLLKHSVSLQRLAPKFACGAR